MSDSTTQKSKIGSSLERGVCEWQLLGREDWVAWGLRTDDRQFLNVYKVSWVGGMKRLGNGGSGCITLWLLKTAALQRVDFYRL